MNVTFIFTNWTYAQYNEFLAAFGNRNFRKAGHLAEIVIADWSAFDIPAEVEHPFDHLSLDDASAIIHAIQAKIKEYTEALDVEKDVQVDLTKWRWNDFNIFQDHVASGRIDSAVDMMLDVARLKKGHPKKDEDVNAIQGIALFTALSGKITRVFNGGN